VEVSRDELPKDLDGTFTFDGDRYAILGENSMEENVFLLVISIKFWESKFGSSMVGYHRP
jgi:hypothetical protein